MIVKGRVSIALPDGERRCYCLPSARGLKLGARANILVIVGQRMLVVWMTRVKGGWRLDTGRHLDGTHH